MSQITVQNLKSEIKESHSKGKGISKNVKIVLLSCCQEETWVWLQLSGPSQSRDGTKNGQVLSDFEKWFMTYWHNEREEIRITDLVRTPENYWEYFVFANFILPELVHKCSELFEFEISENKAIKQSISIRLPGSKTEKDLKTSCVFKTQTTIEEVVTCKKEGLRESDHLYLSQTIQIQLCLCKPRCELHRAQ